MPAAVTDATPVYVLPSSELDQLVGFQFHRGILACGRRPPSTALSDACAGLSKQATAVVCVDVCDPANLGSILRNAAAFGVDLVVISPHCAEAFSRRVLRVSMGAVFQLRLVETPDLARALQLLRDEQSFELLATVLDDDAEPLERAERTARMALLIGSEREGLPAKVTRLCQRRITLAMESHTDSLNAAVASGVFLYHFTRTNR